MLKIMASTVRELTLLEVLPVLCCCCCCCHRIVIICICRQRVVVASTWYAHTLELRLQQMVARKAQHTKVHTRRGLGGTAGTMANSTRPTYSVCMINTALQRCTNTKTVKTAQQLLLLLLLLCLHFTCHAMPQHHSSTTTTTTTTTTTP